MEVVGGGVVVAVHSCLAKPQGQFNMNKRIYFIDIDISI